MALSEAALTIVTAVETELGLAANADTRIEGWINDASDAIAEYLGRTLQRTTSIVEKHAGDGSPSLVLKRPPLVSIASITRYGTAILSSSYEIKDADSGEVLFFGGLEDDSYAFERGVSRDAIVGSERRLYEVTYAGGWITPRQAAVGGTFAAETVTLPSSISRACIELVSHYRARAVGKTDPSVASEAMLSYSVSYRDEGGPGDNEGSSIPALIRGKIRGYRFARI